jgi:hypothetical protein
VRGESSTFAAQGFNHAVQARNQLPHHFAFAADQFELLLRFRCDLRQGVATGQPIDHDISRVITGIIHGPTLEGGVQCFPQKRDRLAKVLDKACHRVGNRRVRTRLARRQLATTHQVFREVGEPARFIPSAE